MVGSTPGVLIVDGYEPWRWFMSSILLKQSGLQIIGEVADGLEAVRRAQELQPDLILMDIGLPAMNGIEAARRIERVVPSAKILFVSHYEDADVMRAALKDGAYGYILKADANGELLPAIEAVIRGERFISKRLKDQKYD